VAFESYQCWSCGGHVPETRIYDVERRVFKNLGRVLNFEWLEGNNFQFKPFILSTCSPNETEIGDDNCYTDPDKLSYKKGSM
jgi:hypothetical protein